jgi:hypothetical protein
MVLYSFNGILANSTFPPFFVFVRNPLEETGCGKSTQCPQFLLDANPDGSIVVTQRKCQLEGTASAS